MTQNQINYAKLREDIRHNVATEGYTGVELAEGQRHNTATEQEAYRHNVAGEQLNWYNAGETQRHNVKTEDLSWYLAPSQKEVNESSANYNDTRSEVARGELDLHQAELDLKNKIADMDWYKIYYSIQNDQERIAVAQQQADTAANRVQAEIERWLRDYEFDVTQYRESGKAQEVSQTVRNYVAAGKDATDIAQGVYDLVTAWIDRRNEKKNWIPEFLR